MMWMACCFGLGDVVVGAAWCFGFNSIQLVIVQVHRAKATIPCGSCFTAWRIATDYSGKGQRLTTGSARCESAELMASMSTEKQTP